MTEKKTVPGSDWTDETFELAQESMRIMDSERRANPTPENFASLKLFEKMAGSLARPNGPAE